LVLRDLPPHNPKVIGSNPIPATSITALSPYFIRAFCFSGDLDFNQKHQSQKFDAFLSAQE